MRVKITERGLIAFITLVSCTSLVLCGHDSIIGYTLLAVVVGYFGLEVSLPYFTGRKKGGK